MLKHVFALLLSALLLTGCAGSPFSGQKAQDIYLVRHAEKEPGRDPQLSPEGKVRASVLAARLADANLVAVYSTDTRRTRQTAGPVALQAGLPVIFYDPSKLDAFAARLRAVEGNVLVVGHSNTTPDLANALGGDGGTPIVEANEYDRLYHLRLDGETVITDLQRFGVPFVE